MHVITSIKIGAKYFFARITHTYLLKLYIHSINYSLTFINSNYFAAKLLLHATFWGEKCGRCLLWYYGIRWFCTYTDAARIHQHFVCIFFSSRSDGKHKLCIIFFVFWDEAKKMRSVQRAKMLLLFVILLVSHSCMKHDDMHWCWWSDQHDKNHWHIFGFKGCLHSIYCITQTEELDFIFTPMGSTQYARNCATLQLRIDCNANSIRWQQV